VCRRSASLRGTSPPVIKSAGVSGASASIIEVEEAAASAITIAPCRRRHVELVRFDLESVGFDGDLKLVRFRGRQVALDEHDMRIGSSILIDTARSAVSPCRRCSRDCVILPEAQQGLFIIVRYDPIHRRFW
jgi:hypothetical protein